MKTLRLIGKLLCFSLLPATLWAQSISLNGSNGYLNFGNDSELDVTENLTFELWLYPTSVSGPRTFFHKGRYAGGADNNGFTARIDNGRIFWYLENNNEQLVSTGTIISENQWVHIALTYDNETARIYINGELEGSLSAANAIGSASKNLVAGRREHEEVLSSPDAYFAGLLDQVRFWERALSQEEIRLFSTIELAGNEHGLISAWQLNENSGTEISDVSGTRTADMIGGASWSSNMRPVFSNGEGTPAQPYLIENMYHLQAMKDFPDAHFELDGNLDASQTEHWYQDAGFFPIGTESSPFTGSFDAGGFEITGLRINRPSASKIGLFGTLDGARIENLNLTNVQITGNSRVGGLVGLADGGTEISNISVEATIIGINGTEDAIYLGGIAGEALDTQILLSNADVVITGRRRSGGIAGGLGGGGSISKSWAKGSITTTDDITGGLVGILKGGTISNAYSIAQVSTQFQGGGLIGRVESTGNTVQRSYAAGLVAAGQGNVHGFIGVNADGGLTLSESFWNTETTTRATNPSGGTGINSVEMRNPATFTSENWDFSDVWEIENWSHFPILKENPQTPVSGEISAPESPVSVSPANEATDVFVLPLFTWNSVSNAQTYDFQISTTADFETTVINQSGLNETEFQVNEPLEFQTEYFWRVRARGISEQEPFIAGNWNAAFTFTTIGFSGGDGTEETPFQISTLEQLQHMRYAPTRHFELLNSLDAADTENWNSGTGFVSIGTEEHPFTGTFDGKNHTISNVFTNKSDGSYASMFGHIGADGEVKNLRLEHVSISSTGNNVGGLVANLSGTIENVHVSGSISGNNNIGGLAGVQTSGLLTQSFSSASVSSSGSAVGGLVGRVYDGSTISRSYASGSISAAEMGGGLIGFIDDANASDPITISDVFATGNVTVSGNWSGGLIGRIHYGTLSRAYAMGEINGDANSGGLIGERSGSAAVNNSYWNTETSGLASSDGGSGLTSQQMRIQNSFATWNFSEIWTSGTENSASFPYLQGMTPADLPGESFTPATVVLTAPNHALQTALLTPLFSWQATHLATSYHLQIATDQEFTELVVTTTGIENTTFTPQSALDSDTWYYWRVRARNENADPAEDGEWSAVRSFKTIPFAGGSGVEGDPYHISTWQQLHEIRNFRHNHFILLNDIDLEPLRDIPYTTYTDFTAYGWEPIGRVSIFSGFFGVLDGNNFAIKNMYIRFDDRNLPIGLFASTYGAVIKNLRLVDFHIDERTHPNASTTSQSQIPMGGLVAIAAETHIENVHVSGRIDHNSNMVGGIVGRADLSSIARSSAHIHIEPISGLANLFYEIGGIAGQAFSLGQKVFEELYATGYIKSHTRVGGLFGAFDGILRNAYSDVTLDFLGLTSTGPRNIGGIAGHISYHLNNSQPEEISNTYSTSTINFPESAIFIGPMFGFNTSNTNVFFNNYFVPELSGYPTDNNATAVTLRDLNFSETFQGFDFDDIWEINQSDSRSYPFLQNLPQDPPPGFSTEPGRIKVITPEDNSGGYTLDDMFFDWEPALLTDAYHFQLSLDSDFSTTLSDFTQTATTYTLPYALELGNIYHWRVRSIQNSPELLYGEWVAQSFRVISFENGAGTEADPWVITTPTQLFSLRDFPDDHFVLGNNLDLSEITGDDEGLYWNGGAGWSPIATEAQPFSGTLDGAGFTISGLHSNRPNTDFIGLFAVLDGAVIKNLKLSGFEITGKSKVGTLAGLVLGGTEIEDIEISGTVTGQSIAGGLVGEMRGSNVQNVVMEATVSGNSRIGGLVGLQHEESNISDIEGSALATGTGSNPGFIGGLVGETNNSEITSVVLETEVSGFVRVGGLVGSSTNNAIITNSQLQTTVNGSGAFPGRIGGLAGELSAGSTIEKSWVIGSVESTYNLAGGLVGNMNTATVENSYAIVEVQSQFQAGGLVGNVEGTDNTIMHTYAAGLVHPGTNNVGGLLGTNNASNLTVTSSYWDLNATERSNSAAGQGLFFNNMRESVSYAGWDFEEIWQMSEGLEATYPYLQNLIPEDLPGYSLVQFAGGSGTVEAPWQIATPAQLYDVRFRNNKHFVLINSVDLSEPTGEDTGAFWNDGAGWEPIGSDNDPMVGTFDGGGFTITGLHSNRPSNNFIGLFGVLNGASITNLRLSDFDISGNSNAGTVAGLAQGGTEIQNIKISGKVTAESLVGGLVGHLHQNSEIIQTGGNVTIIGNGANPDRIGGLVGEISEGAQIRESWIVGSVENAFTLAGGLVGNMNTATIENSYAIVDVQSQYQSGGLIGNVEGGANAITNTYSAGFVHQGINNIGGLVGSNNATDLTTSSSFWDTEASGRPNSAVGVGFITFFMKEKSTYTDWDFEEVWQIREGSDFSYPYLQSVVPDDIPGFQQVVYAGGTGTLADPIQIATPTHLNNVRFRPNSHFILTENLNLADATGEDSGEFWNEGAGWLPIGTQQLPFKGSLDGNGFTISALRINRPSTANVGLFGILDGAKITNIKLADFEINGNTKVGALAGSAIGETEIQIVEMSATLSGQSLLGGLIGEGIATSIHNVKFETTVTGNSRVGGLAGLLNQQSQLEESSGIVVVTGNGSIPGRLGGLAGELSAGSTIETSWVIGSVTSTYNLAGGLVGNMIASTIQNSYAIVEVQSQFQAGGLVGNVEGTDNTIIHTYATGLVHPGTNNVGGLVGTNNASNLTITASYWDIDATGKQISAGGEGLFAHQMREKNSFNGWDFEEVWQIVESSGISYPYLKNLEPEDKPGFVDFNFTDGNGSEAQPWNITTINQLSKVWYRPNDHYILSNNLNLSEATSQESGLFWNEGAGWQPIGNANGPFKGSFDGNGFTITGLHINRPSTNNVGLFAILDGAVINNLKLTEFEITGNTKVGLLAGSAIGGAEIQDVEISGSIVATEKAGGVIGETSSSQLENLNVEVTVSGNSRIGGAVGYLHQESELKHVEGTTEVTGTGSNPEFIGGLVGEASSSQVENLNVEVTVSGNSRIGGAVGYLHQESELKHVEGTTVVTGTGSNSGFIGGLVGEASSSQVENLNVEVTVSGNSRIGGAVGYLHQESEVKYVEGTTVVTGTESNPGFIGGLVGEMNNSVIDAITLESEVTGFVRVGGLVGSGTNNSTLSNVQAETSVNGIGSFPGRLGGLAGEISAGTTIETSWVIGSIQSTYNLAGGLVGNMIASTIENSYAIVEVESQFQAGGLVGNVEGGVNVITHTYAAGFVHPGTNNVGGLVGTNNASNLTITASYWDIDATEKSASAIGTGLNMLEMRNQSSFEAWNFESIWAIENQNGVTSYPYLQSLAAEPLPGKVEIQFAGGEGSIAQPWEITSISHLDLLRFAPEDHFILKNDLNLDEATSESEGEFWFNGRGWSPLGTESVPFRGSFNGDGFTISGVHINRPNENNMGLFGVLDGAEIKNLKLSDFEITGNTQVGLLAGSAIGGAEIQVVEISGSIVAAAKAGGVIGEASSLQVENLNVEVTVSGNSRIGGVVGYLHQESEVKHVEGTTVVTGTGSNPGFIGGLVGEMNNSVVDAITLESEVTGFVRVGGLVGSSTNNSTLSNLQAETFVNGIGSFSGRLGGLAGELSAGSTIETSWVIGSIQSTYNLAGGLVGNIIASTIENSYAIVEVESQFQAGGLVGNVEGDVNTISNTYAAGLVHPGTNNVGGLVGTNNASNLTITASYWDINATGKENSAAGIGRKANEMRNQSSFEAWNFESIWAIENQNGVISYPYLQALAPEPLPGKVEIQFAGGEGSIAQPWEITSISHLDLLRFLPEDHYILKNDLNLDEATSESEGEFWFNGRGWSPLGVESLPFRGSFNGDGFTISGVHINRPNENNMGLFGVLDGAEIKNLKLSDFEITGNTQVGLLAGSAIGGAEILDVELSGSIDATAKAGGVIGEASSSQLENLNVEATVSGNSRIGGVVGYLHQESKVKHVEGTTLVTGTGSNPGLIGGLAGEIATGSTIETSWVIGSVQSAYNVAGGLVGNMNTATIENSYAIVEVESQFQAGGLVGNVEGDVNTISNTYAAGLVHPGTNNVGGLVGTNNASNLTITASYWDIDATGRENSAAGIGRKANEMRNQSSFEAWNFESIWAIENQNGVISYPYLQALAPEPLPGKVEIQFAGGEGSIAQPWEITSISHLDLLRFLPEDHYILKNDLNLDEATSESEGEFWFNGRGWSPLGMESLPFRGSFNGDGFTISGVHINRPNENNMGLFGVLDGAEIKNLKLTEFEITGNTQVGLLAGSAIGGAEIQDVEISGSIVAAAKAGGVIGEASSSQLENLNVEATVSGNSRIGGVVGYLHQESEIKHVEGTTVVTGTGSNPGLIGGLAGEIATGSKIETSWVIGLVQSTYNFAGGLVGNMIASTIENSYAIVEVQSQFQAGGLIGNVEGADNTIMHSYAAGFVHPGTENVGGFLGTNNATSLTATSNFWNINDSGRESSAIGTGLTPTQMRNFLSFNGWDFDEIWQIDNWSHYPVLRALPPDALPGEIEAPDSPELVFPGDESTLRTLLPKFSWNAVESVQTYDIQISETTEFEVISKSITDISENEVTANNRLEQGKTYFWRVRSRGISVQEPLIASTWSQPRSFDTVDFEGGLGTLASPFEISTIDQLQIARYLPEAHFELINNIDATATASWNNDTGFLSIGLPEEHFTGRFNGNNFTISNLFSNKTDGSPASLFSTIGDEGVVENLVLKNVTISSSHNRTGGLAGTLSGTVQNVHISGSVTGNNDVGGLVGVLSGGEISQSSAAVSVSSASGTIAGGLVGRVQEGSVLNQSFAEGNVTATSVAGGLIGWVENDSNTQPISIQDVFATGEVTVANDLVGGLIGKMHDGTLQRAYALGKVSGDDAGGLIGERTEPAIIASSFWNVETSSIAEGMGAGSTDGISGLTTNEMWDNSYYTTWDLENVWQKRSEGEGSFPYLKFKEPSAIPGYTQTPVVVELISPDQEEKDVQKSPVFTWNQAILSDVYQLQIATENDFNAVILDRNDVSETTFALVSELALAGTYYWRVRGINTTADPDVYGSWSEVRAFTVIPFDGEGTMENPWQISNVGQLDAIRDYVSGHFQLTQNLDVQSATAEPTGDFWNDGAGWLPIGSQEFPFTGSFSGDGFTISNLRSNRPEESYVGLFGVLNGASISNLNLFNIQITGNSRVGGLAGLAVNGTEISNISVQGTITGINGTVDAMYLGGIAGEALDTEISLSNADVVITGRRRSGGIAGGLGGGGSIAKSWAAGSITTTDDITGGIAGILKGGEISDSYSVTTVSTQFQGGGLVGRVENSGNEIARSYAAGLVVAGQNNIRGLIGFNADGNLTLTGTFWNSETTAQTTNPAGGISLTTAEMRDASTFIAQSWDFEDIWQFAGNGALSFPYLKNNVPEEIPGYLITPSVVTLLTPQNEAEDIPLQPELTWSETLLAAHYHIQVSNNNDFSSFVVNDEELTDLAFVFETNLNVGESYYWRVRGLNTNANPVEAGEWSEIRSFTTTPFDGAGTEANPYQITNNVQLHQMRNYLTSHFILMNNLDLEFDTSNPSGAFYNNGAGWEPIGLHPNFFLGSLDGNDHTISGLFINRENDSYQGLFSEAGWGGSAEIKNLNLTDINITANSYSGGLVGSARNLTLENIYVSGVISGHGQRIGGVGGNLSNTVVKDTEAHVTITSTSHKVGGFAGEFDNSEAERAFATGTVATTGNQAGGFIGYLENSYLDLVYATGNVSGNEKVGGLIGEMEDEDEDGYSVSRSFATGNVEANEKAGGFAGFVYGYVITNSYATGSVNADSYAGGFIGEVEYAQIASSYSIGEVTAHNNAAGFISTGSGTDITNSFWNTETSGISQASSSGALNGVSALNNSDMLLQSSFSGWNFADIWDMHNEYSFPFIREFGTARVYGKTFAGNPEENNAGWRMITVPENNVRIADLASFNLIQGISGANSFYNDGEDYEASGANLFFYESVGETPGWQIPPSFETNLTRGLGYAWYLYDNDIGPSRSLPFSIVIPSEKPTENVVVPVTADRWNLIGNPFGYPIDGELMSTTNPLMSLALQRFNPVTGSYEIVNLGAGVAMEPWQAYFLDNLTPTEITFPVTGEQQQMLALTHKHSGIDRAITAHKELARKTPKPSDEQLNKQRSGPSSPRERDVTASVTLQGQSAAPNMIHHLRFVLEGWNERTEEFVRDEAISLVMNSQSKAAWDRWDASKLTPMTQSYAIMAFEGQRNGAKVFQSQLSKPAHIPTMLELPMHLMTHNFEGELVLRWSDTETLQEDWNIILRDNLTGMHYDLREIAEINITEFETSVIMHENSGGIGLGEVTSQASSGARFTLLMGDVEIPEEQTEENNLPDRFALQQNYPNPFNPTTNISFQLPQESWVTLEVFDVLGRRVATLVQAQMNAGYHQVTFDGSRLASGVYVYRMQAENFSEVRQMMIIK